MAQHDISKITVTEDVALLTLGNAPAKANFLSRVFKRVSDQGINVDMISQTAVTGEYITVSFTVSDEHVTDVVALANLVKDKHPGVKTLVNNGNVKIALFGEDMPEHPGVAARVFDVFDKIGVGILLITTSETDISVLVEESDYPAAYEALCKEFSLSPEA